MSDFQTTLTSISLQALELQRWEDEGGCIEQTNGQRCYEQVSEQSVTESRS